MNKEKKNRIEEAIPFNKGLTLIIGISLGIFISLFALAVKEMDIGAIILGIVFGAIFYVLWIANCKSASVKKKD